MASLCWNMKWVIRYRQRCKLQHAKHLHFCIYQTLKFMVGWRCFFRRLERNQSMNITYSFDYPVFMRHCKLWINIQVFCDIHLANFENYWTCQYCKKTLYLSGKSETGLDNTYLFDSLNHTILRFKNKYFLSERAGQTSSFSYHNSRISPCDLIRFAIKYELMIIRSAIEERGLSGNILTCLLELVASRTFLEAHTFHCIALALAFATRSSRFASRVAICILARCKR